MVIRTRNHRLTKGLYLRLAFSYLVRRQWWVGALLLTPLVPLILYKRYIWGILPASLVLLYYLFWLVQFYVITRLEGNQLLFESVRYQISSKEILLLHGKQGMSLALQTALGRAFAQPLES